MSSFLINQHNHIIPTKDCSYLLILSDMEYLRNWGFVNPKGFQAG